MSIPAAAKYNVLFIFSRLVRSTSKGKRQSGLQSKPLAPDNQVAQ